MKKVYAHSKNEEGDWHLLADHLNEVAAKATHFASCFKADALGKVVGQCHDLGKINPRFQKYILQDGQGPSVPHSIWGAALLYACIYMAKHDNDNWKTLALPILGHHAGLDDVGEAATKIHEFIINNEEALKQMQSFIKQYEINISKFALTTRDGTERELFIRMLYSCLVDADYLDTEKHFDNSKFETRSKQPTIKSLWGKFVINQNGFMGKIVNGYSSINKTRNEVYKACISAADNRPGLFRLTVPTGGGKTRSGLAFALKHAVEKGLQRVIIAMPYTSIIDQNAQVYREILGDESVLEHHSAIELPNDEKDRQDEKYIKARLATENWDAPLIVTTTVQLFESLFSNKPSKARKLHRLAKSVIILDEVQTLPPQLLLPTFDAIRTLVKDYGTTVVFCTATQPSLESKKWLDIYAGTEIKEINKMYKEHFSVLKRVKYERKIEPITWDKLAEDIRNIPQAMVILNTRKDALNLMGKFKVEQDVFHLSTLLCSENRKKVLDEIRVRLNYKNPKPVKLISTQVVEAGVDIDFPVVYRAIGPLDRIVQAAGRCNRENRMVEGLCVIFDPAEGGTPHGPYKVGLEKAKLLLQTVEPDKLHDPELYREYFNRLYQNINLDLKNIQSYREALNYPEVAHRYKIIESDTVPVLVPYPNKHYIDDLLKDWKYTHDWKKLQPYVVNIYRNEIDKHRGLLEPIDEDLYRWLGGYDEKTGITEIYTDPSDLIISTNQGER